MTKEKTIACEECGQLLRFPADKHIKFNCTNCGKNYEYDKGEQSKDSGCWTSLGRILLIVLTIGVYRECIRPVLRGEKEQSTTREDSRKHQKEWDEKLVTIQKCMDIQNPTTNDFALRLAKEYEGEYNINQIALIYSFIRTKWKYVEDPRGSEEFRSASRSIKNGLAGDCDDFAILMASAIESIGGTTRLSLAYNQESGHAFCEVYAGNSQRDMEELQKAIKQVYIRLYPESDFKLHYSIDKKGQMWLNLDWYSTPPIPGGKYFDYDSRVIFYPLEETPYYEIETNNRS